jgi:hypothetical protein
MFHCWFSTGSEAELLFWFSPKIAKKVKANRNMYPYL